MSGRWVVATVVVAIAITLVNLAILVGQLSTPATARAGGSAGKLLEDEDFTDGLNKLIRKTVRGYCTVGKRGGIDC